MGLHPFWGSYIILNMGNNPLANSQASLGLLVFSLFFCTAQKLEEPVEKEKFPKNAAAEEIIPILEEELHVRRRSELVTYT